MKNKAITPRSEDFARWYDDVVKAARLATYSGVKGCVIIEPNGYAIWENMQKVLDGMFKETGHQNVNMPVFIPESLLNKEAEHVEGFAPEVAWVTMGGKKELEERMCVRPTSETLFSEYYANTVNSHRDLPKLYNQWVNVVRWEKETRPFLRSREFLWQEGHTIHETAKEAEEETMRMLKIYQKFFTDYLAIPAIVGQKTEKEKFAGAEYTYTIEALMYNGVSLQSGTSHYFGQKFSKPFNITFSNRNNELEHVYQTSWGVSTRMIGGLIMVHSDDNGLVLPPKIAPRQVVIVPIKNEANVISKADEILDALQDREITAFVDMSEKSPGFKFAEHETNGIPVRIEIGPRDLEENSLVVARRDTREKMTIAADSGVADYVEDLLQEIQDNLLKMATERRDALTFTATTLEEMEKIMNTQPGFVKAMWCGDEECELKIKEIRGTKSRCIPFPEEQEHISDTCVCCGKPAKTEVIWGIQY
ncbi:MAG: proline--tRNA ligase [Clostridia bacterium]|nr:proline--tRNA ligase [Clostridia bacterium]